MIFHIKKHIEYFLPVLIFLFYFSEAWSTVSVGLWGIKSLVPMFLKSILFGLILVFILIFRRKFFWSIIILTISFCIGQLSLQNPFDLRIIESFIKYLFFLLINIFFVKINRHKVTKLTFKVFEFLIVFNSSIILLAFVFELKIFATYINRFGYSGLFIASSTSSYFYCIALAYLLIRYKKKIFKKSIFYLVFISILILGTKTVLLYFIFSLGIFLIIQVKRLGYKVIIGSIFLLTGLIVIYYFLKTGFFKNITNEKGIITSLLSARDKIFIENFLPFIEKEWGSINYFFGGLSNLYLRPQMEFLDLFLFYGTIGSALYLFMIYYFCDFKIIRFNSLSCQLIILLFCGVFISGNFFYNGSTPIYFVVLILASFSFSKKRIKSQLMTNRTHLFNTSIHNLSMEETLDIIIKSIQKGKQLHHVVVNAGKIVAMQEDDELKQSVNSSDIINADGQAVVWASKLLGKPLKERVAGIDLMENLVKLSAKNNYKIYLLGAKEEVVSKVVKIYEKQHSKNLIAGYRNGYFNKDEEDQIAQDIANSGANLLFVAISSPKKENFLYQHRSKLAKLNFIMGVGGSFDVIAGKTKRAPLWMQNIGLEWFYRFIQEPKRMWKRYLIGNTKFIFLTIKSFLRVD